MNRKPSWRPVGKPKGLFENPEKQAKLAKVAEMLIVSPMRACLGLAIAQNRFDPDTAKRLIGIVDSPWAQQRDPMRDWFRSERETFRTRQVSVEEANGLHEVMRSCPVCRRCLLAAEFLEPLEVCVPCARDAISAARRSMFPQDKDDDFKRVVQPPGRVKLRG